MNIVNTQKYNIQMLREDGTSMPILGAVNNAYIQERYERIDAVNSIPIFKTVSATAENVPPPEEGTFFIVTAQVAIHLKRPDLLTPFHAVRNSQGQIIGFRSFRTWV